MKNAPTNADLKQCTLLAGRTSMCEGPTAPEPKGKEYRSSVEVTLPSLNQRKVLGWMGMRVIGGTCSRSFEEVKGWVYEVVRCSDCSGGSRGTPPVKGAGSSSAASSAAAASTSR